MPSWNEIRQSIVKVLAAHPDGLSLIEIRDTTSKVLDARVSALHVELEVDALVAIRKAVTFLKSPKIGTRFRAFRLADKPAAEAIPPVPEPVPEPAPSPGRARPRKPRPPAVASAPPPPPPPDEPAEPDTARLTAWGEVVPYGALPKLPDPQAIRCLECGAEIEGVPARSKGSAYHTPCLLERNRRIAAQVKQVLERRSA